jgi:hypothetical protein
MGREEGYKKLEFLHFYFLVIYISYFIEFCISLSADLRAGDNSLGNQR